MSVEHYIKYKIYKRWYKNVLNTSSKTSRFQELTQQGGAFVLPMLVDAFAAGESASALGGMTEVMSGEGIASSANELLSSVKEGRFLWTARREAAEKLEKKGEKMLEKKGEKMLEKKGEKMLEKKGALHSRKTIPKRRSKHKKNKSPRPNDSNNRRTL